MADIPQINPLRPIWPVRPDERRRRRQEQDDEHEGDGTRKDRNDHDDDGHIDEYA